MFCENILSTWRKGGERYPFWVVRINLPKLSFESENPGLRDAFTTALSTGFNWPSWQLGALEMDMKESNQVQLLLDGLDEV